MTKLKKFFTKAWFRDELHSFGATFASILAVDGAANLMAIYHGDVSQAVLWSLAASGGRSVIKTALTLGFPTLFPIRKSA